MCFVMRQDSCKPILGVAVDSQDDYLDHIEELTHKLYVAEKSIAVVKVVFSDTEFMTFRWQFTGM